MRATETNVLNFIGGFEKVFIIPPFQRNYEWEIEQCEELFEDIENAFKKNKKHYLGNIVYYVGKNDSASYNEYVLVDGQQRITTVLLLLCALRDSIQDKKEAESINKRYLINDTNENRFRVRLKQTAYDLDSFTEIIDGSVPTSQNNSVIKNYKHFLKLIEQSEIEPTSIYETITKLEVVDVNLQIDGDLEAVQTVFEKINSTGKRLTAADLIRNYLLLAESSEAQEKLYKNYWLKIEKIVLNENISRFSRDYLVMNLFEDVKEREIYSTFKNYCKDADKSNEEILQELLKYSTYYSWLKRDTCPDPKLNRIIKELNILKTDDAYPLYLFLIDKLNCQTDLLTKILKLIADFLLRYRIVAPSGGGGSLRTVVQQLIKKMSFNEIEPTFEQIYFELSNSSTPAGRYPTDDEFKSKLMDSLNTNYARLVLLRIEEKESRNIPVDIHHVTVEHLMPQKLSKWWIESLGGKENADYTYEIYINCIGNLAPVSRGYNSKMSNRPWNEKVEQLRQVQFSVTSEIVGYIKWDADAISKRNELIANRACRAVLGPEKRTRKYKSIPSTGDFEDGIYEVSDLHTPMVGTIPRYIIMDDTHIEVFSWKDYFNKICKLAFEFDGETFERTVNVNQIHKTTSKRNFPDKDPVITETKNLLVAPVKIVGTQFYSEGSLSSERARFYANQLLSVFGISDEVKVSVESKL